MEELKVHIQHVMLNKFKNNKIAREKAQRISHVYGQGVITNCQVRKWFSKFSSSDTSLRNEPLLGCLRDLNQDAFRELVECNPCKSCWVLALDLNTSKST